MTFATTGPDTFVDRHGRVHKLYVYMGEDDTVSRGDSKNAANEPEAEMVVATAKSKEKNKTMTSGSIPT